MKKFDIILFADVTNYLVPVKGMGPYALATKLREAGYSVKVVDQLHWLLKVKKNELLDFVDKIIGENTLFCGFSCTFMNFVTEKGKAEDLGVRAGITERSRRQIDPRNKILGQFQYRRMSDIDNAIYHELETMETFRYLLDHIKEKHSHVKLVLGGRGPNAEVMWRMNPFDHWIQGLAETAVVKFTKELKDKVELPEIYRFDPEASMHDFHNMAPVFSKDDIVLPGEVLPMEISRGCRFKCKFCGFALIGRDPKADKYIRSEESIYRELKNNYDLFGTTRYFMMCDTVNESMDKLRAMERAINRLGVPIEWVGYLRLELLHAHPEQISLLRDIGIKYAHFGIETLNYESAKAVGKGIPTDRLLRLLEKLKETWGHEVGLHSGFIVGLPHETPETLEHWCKMLLNGEVKLDSWIMKGLKIYKNTTEVPTDGKFYWYNKPKKETYAKTLIPGKDKAAYGAIAKNKEWWYSAPNNPKRVPGTGKRDKFTNITEGSGQKTPLMAMQVHQHDDLFLSEFDRNAEKYGYDRSGEYWKNEHWDAVKCQEYANHWNSVFHRYNKCSYSAWQSMAIMNVMTDWNLIRQQKHGHPGLEKFKKHIKYKSKLFRDEFADKLFNS